MSPTPPVARQKQEAGLPVSGTVARQWYTQQTPRAFLIDSDRNLFYRSAIDNFKFPEDTGYLAYLEPASQSRARRRLPLAALSSLCITSFRSRCK